MGVRIGLELVIYLHSIAAWEEQSDEFREFNDRVNPETVADRQTVAAYAAKSAYDR